MRWQVHVASSTNWTKKYKTPSSTMSFLGQNSSIEDKDKGFSVIIPFLYNHEDLGSLCCVGVN